MDQQTKLIKDVALDILAQLMAKAAHRITTDDIDDWFANDDQFAGATDEELDRFSDYLEALAATVEVDKVIIRETDRSTSRHVPQITLDRDELEG